MRVWRSCVIRRLGSRSMVLRLLLRNVLLLLLLLGNVLLLLLLRLLGNVLGLLGSRSLDVLRLLGSRSRMGVTALSLERGVVPAGIVLTVLVVLVQAGSDWGGGKVLGLLLLLHITGSGRGGGGMGWGSWSDWQMVSGGTESEINRRR